MLLKALTNGKVTGTDTITCESGIIGGVLISTDNTNAAVVALHRDSAGGKQIIEIDTITTIWISGPFWMEETTDLYYSVTGTGASAQFYEWIL